MKRIALLALAALLVPAAPRAAGNLGYYRFPAIHGDVVVFTAEGDLWTVALPGGIARRLTTHPGVESHPAISPDGSTIAFSAQYEGPTEVYTIPAGGGAPRRLTWEGGNATVAGWTRDGRVLYATTKYSGLPSTQLAALDAATGARELVPLAQAAEGDYDGSGGTLFFTRLPFQGSHTKRYEGGTVQTLWKFPAGAAEAAPLTADYAGTSKTPMWWKGRVYFASDRDGTMNIWSIDENGGDPRQHTRHAEYDANHPCLEGGRIVYQRAGDIYLYDIEAESGRKLEIALASDFDQTREQWVGQPVDYLTSYNISPDGKRVVLTARGRVFVAPAGKGRLVQATRSSAVRYRCSGFMPDGSTLLALSDESGELEFVTIPANGIGEERVLTSGGKVFRNAGVPSPDGKRIAFTDKNNELWLLDVEKKDLARIARSEMFNFSDLAWSPDGAWLAFVETGENQFQRVKICRAADRSVTAVTSDRVDSFSPAWSPDGKWLYFLSDRSFENLVGSPWGANQPEPFFDRTTKVYMAALRAAERSPFLPDDELAAASAGEASKKKNGEESGPKLPPVEIELDGLADRVLEVPAPAGNYADLSVNASALFWIETPAAREPKRALAALEITNKDPKPKTLVEDVQSYAISGDGKKLALRKEKALYVIDASSAPPSKLDEAKVDLGGWSFSVTPREEWRQIFVEAWRLARDNFYDRNLHGADYRKLLDRYMPLVDRVTDRDELGEVVAQLLSELSTLHTFVSGGAVRRGADNVNPASLGARLARDEKAGGYRVEHIYRGEPDYPDRLSPLARPGTAVADGDVITAINGVSLLDVDDPAELLRNQAGKQVRLEVVPASGGEPRSVIVEPITPAQEQTLRYDEWEYTRRLAVEEMGDGEIGYVHLRAMGGDNFAEWVRNFYPVYRRKGLVIDVRNNNGGNIDSWILEKLLRRAWFYWQPRVGKPFWNMQYAFRGHLVVICNERTSSDGEAFAEGFRRFGLGKVIGTRTWGGEVWLSITNALVDRGIASAAELGVYGPEGEWLIEGHGVDPDVVVDNPPHATFRGRDAQLEAAVAHLRKKIAEEPVEVPPAPPYPLKSK